MALTRIIAAFLVVCLVASAVPAQEKKDLPPVIKHQPVTAAVRDQPVTVLATVTDDSGNVKSVTLFYSLSKDAAPFRAMMKSSGTATYYGTIPASMVGGADTLSYYIEALDFADNTQETPWYTIRIKSPGAPAKAAPAATTPAAQTVPGGAAAPVAPSQPAPDRDRSSLLGMGIIAGGAAAVLGGALLMSKSDSGGSDSSSSTDTNSGVQAGAYIGSVTECVTYPGQAPACSSHAMTVDVRADGIVRSETLREGTLMEAPLNGKDFTLVAPLVGTGTNQAGSVMYSGTVINRRIVGSISGNATSASGNGVFSGTFSADLR
jgi:hypothetical protein